MLNIILNMNIKNLKMADAIFSNDKITLKKSFMGFGNSVVYTPTGSKIKAIGEEYSQDAGNKIEAVINAKDENLEAAVKEATGVKSAAMSSIRLEGCISDDHEFVALQLLAYKDFRYSPITDVRIYEGKSAEIVSRLF
ncbi:hypothetical protein prwr041_18460 [Prevotella herbatica]|uniref:Uncharacterized protein n=2 Tax=Prevotella herbatica TaxID=2801997 RepID=A0ABN6EMH3_9BACT|nr:hypothetical protein prwr041_18460 [Prevotella herbatica]